MERIKQLLTTEPFSVYLNYFYALFLAFVAQLGTLTAIVALVAAFYYAKTQRYKSNLAKIQHDKECNPPPKEKS